LIKHLDIYTSKLIKLYFSLKHIYSKKISFLSVLYENNKPKDVPLDKIRNLKLMLTNTYKVIPSTSTIQGDIMPSQSILKGINRMIRYTSNRTTSSLKELTSFPSIVLTFK